jgi:CDP-paratose 2-epimerase
MGRKYLITGGAGFIGSNYVHRLLSRGEQVVVYDNLSRVGAPKNLRWLRQEHGDDSFELVIGDVRDASLLAATARDAQVIVHLASQVAVTTSVLHPREDFEINALGTLNVLEAARLSESQPAVLYASTNKVYGGMEAGCTRDDATRLPLPVRLLEGQRRPIHA